MFNDLKYPKGARTNCKRKGQVPARVTARPPAADTKARRLARAVTSAVASRAPMPSIQRLAKRGFTNIFRTEYQVVNIGDLNEFAANSKVDKEALTAVGLVRQGNRPVKLLGAGELKVALTITIDKASKSAIAAVEAAGGQVNTLG